MTTVILFANDASSTIQSPIGPGATTVNIAPGTGATFPSPAAGQIFKGTFTDAATGLVKEIVDCTGVTGDVVTIVRGREGTTARSWNAGDHFDNLWTAGSAEQMLQQDQVPQFNNYAADSGSVNALVVTLSPAPIDLADIVGLPIYVKVAHANTSISPTINVNGFGPQLIVAWSPAGAIASYVGMLGLGQIAVLVWDGTYFQYQGNVVLPGAAQANTPSVTTSGYQYLDNGLILQWGSFVEVGTADSVSVSFPVKFTRQPSMTLGPMYPSGLAASKPIILSVSSFPFSSGYPTALVTGTVYNGSSFVPVGTGGVANATFTFNWVAIGPYQ